MPNLSERKIPKTDLPQQSGFQLGYQENPQKQTKTITVVGKVE